MFLGSSSVHSANLRQEIVAEHFVCSHLGGMSKAAVPRSSVNNVSWARALGLLWAGDVTANR